MIDKPDEIHDGTTVLIPYRCGHCGRLQFYANLVPGSIVSVACWHMNCRRINKFIGATKPVLVVDRQK